ncbi:MAG: rhomboid family intrarane serine protease [Actinomycetia bacterium]|nr:rhomboid family intrarane serine protease [Actinomycetes bacterium]
MNEMKVQQRFGLERLPVVTVAVFAVTAVMNGLQFAVHGLLEHLQRTPAGLEGDWWRSFTSLFVQDGGVFGTVSNLAFLLVIGALADQVLRPGRWLVCYFGAGLAGELAGYAWQPHGGGNSVAICGLAGALIVATLQGDARVPTFAPTVLMYWSAALLGSWWPLLVVGVVLGLLATLGIKRGLPVRRPVAVIAALVGAGLALAQDIHGAAMVAGIVIAALLALVVRERTAIVQA